MSLLKDFLTHCFVVIINLVPVGALYLFGMNNGVGRTLINILSRKYLYSIYNSETPIDKKKFVLKSLFFLKINFEVYSFFLKLFPNIG